MSIAQGVATLPPRVQQDDLRQQLPPLEQRLRCHSVDARKNKAFLPYHSGDRTQQLDGTVVAVNLVH